MLLGPKISNGTLTAGSPLLMPILLVLYAAIIYVGLALSWKRAHDTDKSGWWSLVPIYGFIVCGFLPGTGLPPGTFGPDPKAGPDPGGRFGLIAHNRCFHPAVPRPR